MGMNWWKQKDKEMDPREIGDHVTTWAEKRIDWF